MQRRGKIDSHAAARLIPGHSPAVMRLAAVAEFAFEQGIHGSFDGTVRARRTSVASSREFTGRDSARTTRGMRFPRIIGAPPDLSRREVLEIRLPSERLFEHTREICSLLNWNSLERISRQLICSFHEPGLKRSCGFLFVVLLLHY